MLTEGNEGFFCVTLNNRKLTSLDKVLLGSPINIVIPLSPKFYLQYISIIFHTFDAIESESTQTAFSGNGFTHRRQDCLDQKKPLVMSESHQAFLAHMNLLLLCKTSCFL